MPEDKPKSLRDLLQPITARQDNTRTVQHQNKPTLAQIAANKKEYIAKQQAEIARRKEAIAKSNTIQAKAPLSREAFATTALGDKARLFPDDADSFVDDYINPVKMIGDMADGIGHAFAGQNTNWKDKLLAVSAPLVAGALGGIGAKTNRQFINNVINPVAGVEDMLIKPTSSLIPKQDDLGITSKIVDDIQIQKHDGYTNLDNPKAVSKNSDTGWKNLKFHVDKSLDIPEHEFINTYKELTSNHPDLGDKTLKFIMTDKFGDRAKPSLSNDNFYPLEGDRLVRNDKFIADNKLRTEYTPKEQLMVSQYTKGFDEIINGRRHRNPSGHLKSAIENYTREFEDLVQQNKFINPTTVYRGIREGKIPSITRADGTVENNVKFSQLREGDIYEPDGFTSTSIEPHVAKTFGDIRMNIKIPGGSKQSVLYPNATGASSIQMEAEAILPNKLKYRVDRVNYDKGETKPEYDLSILNPYLKAGAVSSAGFLGLKANEEKQ